jgi:hypothetical protein
MLVSVCLEIVLIMTQDRCTVCAERTIGAKSLWTHLMVLLDDVARVQPRFGPFGASANLDARYVHGLRRTYHRLENHFRCSWWYS